MHFDTGSRYKYHACASLEYSIDSAPKMGILPLYY